MFLSAPLRYTVRLYDPPFESLSPHINFQIPIREVIDLSAKSLETLGVASVHASVRSYVTLFLGNLSLLFSETLQLVRACRCEKNVLQALFYNFHRFGDFG